MSQESGKVPSGTELMHEFCDRTIGEVMNDLRRENAALKAELERVRKDAEKYQWLREEYTSKPFDERTALRGENLDDAIDAAMRHKAEEL